MKKSLMSFVLICLITSPLNAQSENTLGLGELRMSSSSDLFDCIFRDFQPWSIMTVNFIIVPPAGGTIGAKFSVINYGPDYYFQSMLTNTINESVVSSFSGESVFAGIEVILNQCITEPTVIFSHDFLFCVGEAEAVVLIFGEHPDSEFGLYDCNEPSLLMQSCYAEYLINTNYASENHNCGLRCPTIANESTSWGAIKSIYSE